MADKPHLSPSSVESFTRCPEAWRRRYIEGDRQPPRLAMLEGTGVHHAAKTNFSQKIESHADLPRSQIVEAAVAGFEAATREGCGLTREEASRGADIVLGEAKDNVADLASLHARVVAPLYQPVLVEQQVRLTIPDASHDLLGVIDLADTEQRVIDHKVSGRRKSQHEADHSIQLTYYAAAHRVATGRDCTEVRLETLVKKARSERQLLRSTRGLLDFEALAHRLNTVMKAINSGIFPPATPGAWWCSDRWCPYFQTCPYVNSERQELVELKTT